LLPGAFELAAVKVVSRTLTASPQRNLTREGRIMAAKKCNTAPGIVIADSEYWTKYRGTKEALIAAGICTEEQFPVTPKRMREGDMDSLTSHDRVPLAPEHESHIKLMSLYVAGGHGQEVAFSLAV
jgi:hypothetical protein